MYFSFTVPLILASDKSTEIARSLVVVAGVYVHRLQVMTKTVGVQRKVPTETQSVRVQPPENNKNISVYAKITSSRIDRRKLNR